MRIFLHRRRILVVSLFISLFGLVAAGPSSAGRLFGPDSPEECREDYISGAETDLAVKLVYNACSQLFKKEGRHEWAECILEYTADTGSDVAIKVIASACSRMANNGAKKEDRCLLKKLPGTSSDLAAKQITYACRS